MPLPEPEHHTISLATFRRGGEQVRTPVWHIVSGGSFWVITFRDSWKARRLRNNPNLRFAPCDSSGKKILGEWTAGTAELIEAPERLEWLVRELKRKYSWRYLLIVQVIYPLAGRRGARVAIEITPDP